jgi:hypothetical protein
MIELMNKKSRWETTLFKEQKENKTKHLTIDYYTT